jgi:nitrilase
MTPETVRVAVVQAAPVLFDKAATVDKAIQQIQEAATNGATFVLLPEAFIPAYPRGFHFGAAVGSRSNEGRALWQRLWDESVDVPGPETDLLAAACREANVTAAIGVIEREHGTLYCSLLYIGPDGALLGCHRKLKPTGTERLIWGEGDGSTLTVYSTPAGRIGGLICWENYMPLARMALYSQGLQLYLAPTADARDTWQATLRHIALEGRCFVLSSNQYVTTEMYPQNLPLRDELLALPETACRGGSAIVSPLGEVLAGPVYDREEILYATLDLDEIPRGKFDLDVAGHYARPDVFQLTVHGKPIQSLL